MGKTKYFLFSKKGETVSHGKVFMNGQEVQRVGKGQKQETYKYLGVLIGEDLTFDDHINVHTSYLSQAPQAVPV